MGQRGGSRMSGILVILVLLGWTEKWHCAGEFDVTRYGAAGDGYTDDSNAFFKAWTDACSSIQSSSQMTIPARKTFLLNPLVFNGPCKSPIITVMILGDIVAPNSTKPWEDSKNLSAAWLTFGYVTGLNIMAQNGATLNGMGHVWWPRMCANTHLSGCIQRGPAAIFLLSLQNVNVAGLRIVNSQQVHMSIYSCQNVYISNVYLNSPGDSPNTDGIDLGQSQHIHIDHSAIEVGDDCIAMGNGIYDVNITRIVCGPGHGISIGSLGKDGGEGKVDGVGIRHSQFYNTQNGARIKTWQGGYGYVRNIHFQNLTFTNVKQPFIIDQYYCPGATCRNQTNAVQISDVLFAGSQGTSSSKLAIILACSESVACTNIVVKDIDLVLSGSKGKETTSYCLNAHGVAEGQVIPKVPCLQPASKNSFEIEKAIHHSK